MNTKIILVAAILIAASFAGYYFTTQKSIKAPGETMMEKASPSEAMMQKKEGETGMMKDASKETSMTQDSKGSAMEEKNGMIKDEATDAMEMNKARYVDYSESSYKSLAAKKRVLFFFASWCPTCIPADAEIKANVEKLPSDVAVLKVHYNDPETTATDRELAKKYAVTYQHTFVQLDAQGNAVTKWNGGGYEEIIKNIQ